MLILYYCYVNFEDFCTSKKESIILIDTAGVAKFEIYIHTGHFMGGAQCIYIVYIMFFLLLDFGTCIKQR